LRDAQPARNLLRVSYVPYDPDVWPTATTEDTRHSRIGKWVWGIVLYLLAIVAWVAWMKMPPKIEAPLALIPLPDGTELRLVHSTTGPYSGVAYNSTFGNRIRLREGATSWGMRETGTNGGWIVLTQFNPRGETFSAPEIENLEITEPGSPYSLVPAQTQSNGAPYSVVLFHAVPRRTPTLTVNFKYSGAAQQATFANPFYLPGSPAFVPSKGAVAQAGPAPLPQQLEAGGFVARVDKVFFRATPLPTKSGSVQAETALSRLKVTFPHSDSTDFQVSEEWFDPTGNIVKNGVLPWSEPVWGLRVKVWEGTTFPIPAERRVKIGNINVPAPGQIVALKVPQEMKSYGVTDILALGAGAYSRTGRVLTGRAATGGALVSSVNLNGFAPVGGFTPSTWEIRIFSTSRKDPDGRGRVRVLTGDQICQVNSTGSISSNDIRMDYLGSIASPKTGSLQVGQQVSVEVFQPKTYTLEFQIPRPEFKRK
jgi:hypothetical protein